MDIEKILREPVAYEITDDARGNRWVMTIQNPERYAKDYPELKLVPLLYAYPLLEELETMRASNTIKQANIELLQAENAKLIAERDAMMKQEPIAWRHTERDDVIHSKVKRLVEDAYEKYGASSSVQRSPVNKAERYSIPLYTRPLPAQQIPEGYALVPIEPTDAMVEMGARNIFSYGTVDRSAKEVYKAMLSASQPKGDV